MLTVILAGVLLVQPVAVPIPGGEGGIGFAGGRVLVCDPEASWVFDDGKTPR